MKAYRRFAGDTCRRARSCRGDLAGPDDPPCSALWSEEAATRISGALIGVLAAWHDESRRNEQLRARCIDATGKNGKRQGRAG